jgi:hypothetical protein
MKELMFVHFDIFSENIGLLIELLILFIKLLMVYDIP